MTLLFIDGFDHYDAFDRKYDYVSGTPSISSGQGRNSTDAITGTNNSYVGKFVNAGTNQIIFGFAFKTSSAQSEELFRVSNVGGTVIILSINTDFSFDFGSHTTAANLFSVDEWNYMEGKVVFNENEHTGYLELRQNGAVLYQENQSVGTNESSEISDFRLDLDPFIVQDDFYVLDSSTGLNTDFLGNVYIETLLPDGTTTSDFSLVGAATHHQAVNGVPQDTASYVTSSTATDQELYTYDNTGFTGFPIMGVQLNSYSTKDNAGDLTYKALYGDGVSTVTGKTFYLRDFYQFDIEIQEREPVNDVAWTDVNLNSAQFGVELQ